eukprot:SAG31_NODE_8_length_42345_cov_10.980992_17_plen_218_part_00
MSSPCHRAPRVSEAFFLEGDKKLITANPGRFIISIIFNIITGFPFLSNVEVQILSHTHKLIYVCIMDSPYNYISVKHVVSNSIFLLSNQSATKRPGLAFYNFSSLQAPPAPPQPCPPGRQGQALPLPWPSRRGLRRRPITGGWEAPPRQAPASSDTPSTRAPSRPRGYEPAAGPADRAARCVAASPDAAQPPPAAGAGARQHLMWQEPRGGGRVLSG